MSYPPVCRRTAACLAVIAGALLIVPQAEARSLSVTGRNGGTFSRTVTPYHNGGGNFGRTVTTTRPDGATSTRQFSQTNNGNGTFTDSRTVTLPGGQSYSNSITRY